MSAPDLQKTRRTKQPGGVLVDRLPPHSIEMEQGVIGSILLNPQVAIPMVLEKIPAESSDAFYDLRHQTLYVVLLAMYDERLPIDTLTVSETLRDTGQLEAIGGVPYLAELPDTSPSAGHAGYYADMVLEKWTARRLISACTETVGRAYEQNGDGDTNALLEGLESGLLALRAGRAAGARYTTPELVTRAIDRIESMHASQGVLTGLATGLVDLDKMTGGLQNGDEIVLAGRPSIGKSALAMNIAEHVAVDQRLPVGVFSLEMTADSLMMRLMSSRARVNLRNIREGFLAERDFPRLANAAGQIRAAPLFIDDTPALTIMQLRAKARRMHQQHGLRLLIVDYLQLLHAPTGRKNDSREQEVGAISGGLKALAKELDIPVIALAQLNRDVEKREKGKPRLSDLRESGRIEADADLVGLLYREISRDDEENAPHNGGDCLSVTLLIEKQRNGDTGPINLMFLRSCTRFESAARIAHDPGQTTMPYAD